MSVKRVLQKADLWRRTGFCQTGRNCTTFNKKCAGAACLALAWGAFGPVTALADAVPPTGSVIASIDLARAFGTRSGWRLTATQGPPLADAPRTGDEAPGAITLCLRKALDPCDPQLQEKLPLAADAYFAERHYLDKADIVHPPGAPG